MILIKTNTLELCYNEIAGTEKSPCYSRGLVIAEVRFLQEFNNPVFPDVYISHVDMFNVNCMSTFTMHANILLTLLKQNQTQTFL